MNVESAILEGGHEQRNDYWDGQYRSEFMIGYGLRTLDKVSLVDEIFKAIRGPFHGLRMRDWRDYKSVMITSAGPEGDTKDPITATDQVISNDTTTQDIFQLCKTYRWGWLATTKPVTKPQLDTVAVAIQGITIPSNRYDLLYVPTRYAREGHETVGRVTLSANIQKTIGAITSAASAKITTTTNHGLSVNDSVHIGSVSGMTGINGKRGLVTLIDSATQFTVAINSTGLGTYTSGGQINTRRQSLAFTVSVTAITKHARGLVTTSAPHNLVAGDVGVFASIGGMTQLNAVETTVMEIVSSTQFRINEATLEMSTYTSGGTFAVAERVTAGFVYDLPVRFNQNNLPSTFEAWEAAGLDLPVIELRVDPYTQ